MHKQFYSGPGANGAQRSGSDGCLGSNRYRWRRDGELCRCVVWSGGSARTVCPEHYDSWFDGNAGNSAARYIKSGHR